MAVKFWKQYSLIISHPPWSPAKISKWNQRMILFLRNLCRIPNPRISYNKRNILFKQLTNFLYATKNIKSRVSVNKFFCRFGRPKLSIAFLDWIRCWSMRFPSGALFSVSLFLWLEGNSIKAKSIRWIKSINSTIV